MHGSDSEQETHDLCRRCAEGDEDAFSEVYRRFGGTLYGAAWRILKSPQEAEEVVQEAFLTLYRHAPDNPPRNLGGWLHRVAVNRSLDRIRSRTRRGEVELLEDRQAGGMAAALETAPGPGADLGAGGSAAGTAGGSTAAGGAPYGVGLDLERAIERLPERTRMIFLLHDVEGFKHREIGEMLEISDGTSKSQLFRARALLRDWLGHGDPQ